jgi:hypothetical protein
VLGTALVVVRLGNAHWLRANKKWYF